MSEDSQRRSRRLRGPDATAQKPADLTPSLVARLRSGDTTAGGLLDSLYASALLRFCRSYLSREEDARDAVQEVFCTVLRTTDVPDNFRAWLYRIARNHCLSVLRARACRGGPQQPTPAAPLAADATSHLARLVRQEDQAHVARVLATLPAEQREVFLLRHGEDLSRAEIAHVLSIDESTVKSRLFQAVKKLREHTSLLDER